MPKGPHGEKRPADAIGLAVMVGKIATGEIADTRADPAKAHHSAGGKKGGPARAAKLSPQERSEIARRAADHRWAAKLKKGHLD
jgi:hypothetical protein